MHLSTRKVQHTSISCYTFECNVITFLVCQSGFWNFVPCTGTSYWCLKNQIWRNKPSGQTLLPSTRRCVLSWHGCYTSLRSTCMVPLTWRGPCGSERNVLEVQPSDGSDVRLIFATLFYQRHQEKNIIFWKVHEQIENWILLVASHWSREWSLISMLHILGHLFARWLAHCITRVRSAQMRESFTPGRWKRPTSPQCDLEVSWSTWNRMLSFMPAVLTCLMVLY